MGFDPRSPLPSPAQALLSSKTMGGGGGEAAGAPSALFLLTPARARGAMKQSCPSFLVIAPRGNRHAP